VIPSRLGILVIAAVAASLHSASGQNPPARTGPASPLVAEQLQKRGIVGYADRLGVQPGQTVRFMVSSEFPQYRADIVRLIHGDANPKGPGIKEVVIDTPVNREHPGKRQDLPFGSCITVPDNAALRLTGSFTISAWIAPTTPGQSFGARAAQGVLTKWSDARQQGYGVFIDEEGRLAAWLSDKSGRVEKVQSGVPLRVWTPAIPGADRPRPQGVTTFWYFIAVSFDASTGKVVFVQQPLNSFPGDPTRAIVERTTPVRSLSPSDVPLMIAAYSKPGGSSGGHYNGKIDNPRLYGRALSRQEITAIQQGSGPTDAIANWDFSADISSDKVTDTSARRLHGQTVNMPMRAVTGHNWNFTEMDFKHARPQYGAIYFHDDDLLDARWEPGFELRVPDTLKSGIYAARLRAGSSEDYVPFFVRPKAGAPTAKIAFLVPTFSYLAYASTNEGGSFRALSLYSSHTDGSGIAYSSRLRPITNMRPKITTNNPWQFMADTHLVDWLDVKGFAVDVITDEDVHAEGLAVLEPYNVVVTGTHPEYTSVQMLDAFDKYLNQGGRMMYMGGNGFYWVTTLDPTGRYIEVRRRDGTEHWQGAPGEHYHATTGESGGLWRFRGRPPQMLFGVGFTAQGFDRNSPFRRAPGSFDPRAAFIFEGIGRDELIGEQPSLVLQVGAAGSELDRVDYALGSPPHTLILATSFGHSDAYHHVVEEVNTSNSRQHGTVNPLVKADIAFLEYPNGGAVFSTSSIAWSGSLSYNNYDNNVSRVTENVLRRFASDTPIPWPTGPTTTSQDSRQPR
jgi:N,N-dimethylformamidase